jgi:F-type H+-transporting ATPase subunit gamma
MNLRQVRKKTKSVSNVKKITYSMQLVSGIRMKKSQQAAIESRPYQDHLESVLQRVVGKIDPSYSPLLNVPEDAKKKDLLIFVSANKGMCGSFIFDLFRYITKEVNIKNTDFLVVGKKGASFISKCSGTIIADFSAASPIQNVSAIFTMVLDLFLKGSYQSVDILYNRFLSAFKVEPIRQRLLPFSFPGVTNIEKKQVHEYLIEPKPEILIDSLLKSYIEEKIRNVLVQSEAGEHSARMMAMKNATDNANDIIYNLTLLGNKLRQEKITGELLDMVTAKESVGS